MGFRLPKVSIITSDSSGNNLQGEFSTLSIGLGLHRAWTYLSLFCATTVFSTPVILSSDAPVVSLNLFYLICTIVTIVILYAAAGLIARFRDFLLSDRAVPICCILCTAGSALLLFCSTSGAIGVGLSIIASALCGTGNAAIILMWAMSYSRHESMTIVVNTAVSIFIAVLIYALLTIYVPKLLAQILTAALPVLQIPFLSQQLHPKQKRIAGLPKPSLLPTRKRSLGIRLALPLFLFGFALGIVRYFAETTVNASEDPLVFFLALLLSGVLMIFLLVILFYFSQSHLDESLMRYLIPILILGVIFLPIPSMMGHVAAGPLLMASYLCFKAVIWIFLCGTCQRFRLSPIFVIGTGFASMALGSFLSSLSLVWADVIVLITPFGDYALLVLAVIAMVVAYSLLPRAADIKRMVEIEASAQASKKERMHEETGTSEAVASISRAHDAISQRNIDRSSKEQDDATTSVTLLAAHETNPPKDSGSHDNAQVSAPAGEGRAFRPHQAGLSGIPSSQEVARMSSAPTHSSTISKAASPAPSSMKKTVAPSAVEQSSSPEVLDAFRDQCDMLSNKFLLSRRESEVLYLLARGHNAAYIQDKLCVAQSTTKTHIYHIYQKLGIHTQQELITMVAEGME